MALSPLFSKATRRRRGASRLGPGYPLISRSMFSLAESAAESPHSTGSGVRVFVSFCLMTGWPGLGVVEGVRGVGWVVLG
jgi:hypothetical protein